MPENFAAFILTHGRPGQVITLNSLADAGYSGRWYLVVDDEDATLPEYIARYGQDRVLVFSKAQVARTMDLADTGGSNACVVFARNACDGLAAGLGITRYIQLDDDYRLFAYRYTDATAFRKTDMRRMDDVLKAMMEFQDACGPMAVVAMAQTGDFLGGFKGTVWTNRLARKAMNSFICRTGEPIDFPGRINEDVNAYVVHGGRGRLFLTVAQLHLWQTPTQQATGGMSETYASGTYRKSMYTVMMRPDAVRVGSMGWTHRRWHHAIRWNNAVPKIVSSRYRRDEVTASP